jgi:3-oxoacyl-[acyl-carrier protein] reductase
MKLHGARVLLTGASRGIGREVARRLAGRGARLVLVGRDPAAVAAVCNEIFALGGRADSIVFDLAASAGHDTVVGRARVILGGIDVLVNNAGGMVKQVKLSEYSDAIFDEVADLNVRSILAVTRAALPLLKSGQGGSIINIGSIAGRNGGAPGSALYAAAKAAVHSLTRGMALEFAADGVRVNAIAPGLMVTRFHDNTPKERLESVRLTVPLRRLGTAEDCAGACLFLASPAMSGYVTGQIIDVNGGRLMP